MMEDPIVNEVHETRQRILKECDGQIDRLIERLKAVELQAPERLVTIQDVQRRAAGPQAADSP